MLFLPYIQEIMPMSINYEILGDRIRLIRKNLDLSQKKLAEAANLTRESINRIENGSLKAKLDTIAVIASILNISSPTVKVPNSKLSCCSKVPSAGYAS